jgi:hypothetical protein
MRLFDQNKTYYVYEYRRTTASANGTVGSPYYVGKGKGRRAYSEGRGVNLPKDMSCIVLVSENMNEADALQLEILLISLYGRIDIGTGTLRNMTNGGDGTSGWVPSDETRANISKANIGKKRTEETNAKHSKSVTGDKNHMYGKTGENSPHFGKKHTDETKAKMSLACTGDKNHNFGRAGEKHHMFGIVGEKHPNYGQKRSEETRAKMSVRMIGNSLGRAPRSDETRAKMSLARKLYWATKHAKDMSVTSPENGQEA